jgi:hypothetical protein
MPPQLKRGSNLTILLPLTGLQNDTGSFDYPLRHRAPSRVHRKLRSLLICQHDSGRYSHPARLPFRQTKMPVDKLLF